MKNEVRPPARWLADIGNSRMKWARLGPSERLSALTSHALSDPAEWVSALENESVPTDSMWAIASVNPTVACSFIGVLRGRGCSISGLYDSAAKVPMRTSVQNRETAGADRALAVLAAIDFVSSTGPGLVISCGTAITVERIDHEGVWEGGAIAVGLGLAARSLHRSTAQLPWIPTHESPVTPWGASTEPAIAAGVFWGTVGTIRELITRQGPRRWTIWTGGDAERLSTAMGQASERDHVIPGLVLRGLALAEFGVPVSEDLD